MIKRIMMKLLFLSLISVSTTSLSAISPQDELKKNLSTFHSFQASFSKVVTDGKNRVAERSFGVLSLRQPNQFRWEIEKPNQQLIVSDGRKIWNYDVALKQVIVKPFPRIKNELPSLILSGYDESVINNYRIQRSVGAILLDAKSNSAVFRRLYVWFDHNRLTRMTMYDHLGYKTDLNFSEIEMNPKLNTNLFRFTPPEGVDIVRQ